MSARKLLAIAGCAVALCAGAAARRFRSTARARRSRTRSTRSGSASTTSCTRACRSTTSRSDRAAASGRSPKQTVFFGATDGPMTDEQLLAAPGKILHFPTVLGARRADLQHPGRERRAEVHRRRARGHLPRQDHQVERPGDREAEPRRQAARHGHHRRPPLRRQRARPTSGSTTWRRCRRSGRSKVGVATAVNWPVGVGGKGNEGVAGLVKQTPGSIGYVELIYALQNKISYGIGAEHGRRVREAHRSTSVTAAAAAAAAARCRRTSACRSRTRRAKASIRSRRSPGCCSTRTRRTRPRRRRWSTS